MPADITLSGARLTAKPDLVILPNSGAVALKDARVAINRRYQDKQTGEWKDAGVTFLSLVAYGRLAEEIEATMDKGDMVIGKGTLEQRDYETKDGEKRSVYEVRLTSLGLDLSAPRRDESRQKEYDEKPPF